VFVSINTLFFVYYVSFFFFFKFSLSPRPAPFLRCGTPPPPPPHSGGASTSTGASSAAGSALSMRVTQLASLPELPASLRQLKSSQPVPRCARFALLQRFNSLLMHFSALVHTGPVAQGPHTLGGRLCCLRGLIFLEVLKCM